MSGFQLDIAENVPLAPYTTLGIGGAARFFAVVETEAQLLTAIRSARAYGLRTFILGGGSNLLVADEGFNGLVIHAKLNALGTHYSPDGESLLANVDAGTPWDGFVLDACARGLGGVECLAGIPGLAGGTPVQNVGAYGQEVAQTVDRVTVLDLESLQFRFLDNSQCRFAYRASAFNSTERGRYVVTAVRFRLVPGAKPHLTYADLAELFAGQDPTLLDVYHAVRAVRRSKGMLLVDGDPDCRSAGSFFKNPIVPMAALATVADALAVPAEAIPHWPAGQRRAKLPAAWLVEKAGFHKGFALGAAGISTRHTLALVNRTGTATCADILRLRDRIAAEVRSRFGIELEQEPVCVGP